VPGAALPASSFAVVPRQFVRGGWMMLAASFAAAGACVFHQTTVVLPEMAAGVPLLLITGVLMLVLRGAGRFVAALLAVGCAVWAVWQGLTYLPMLHEFLDSSWPDLTWLLVMVHLPVLAAVRCLKSLLSPPWRLREGRPPARRRAIFGVLWVWFVVGLLVGFGFLPTEVRRPLVNVINGQEPEWRPNSQVASTPTTSGTATRSGKTYPENDYNSNPVMPPMSGGNSTASEQGTVSGIRMVSTAPQPGQTVVIPTAPIEPAVADPIPSSTSAVVRPDYSVTPAKRRGPHALPNIAREVAALPKFAEVSFSATQGRSRFRINPDARIVSQTVRPDGTDLVRVRCTTTLEDASGRKTQGQAFLNIVVDAKGRILHSGTPEIIDQESESMGAAK